MPPPEISGIYNLILHYWNLITNQLSISVLRNAIATDFRVPQLMKRLLGYICFVDRVNE